MHFVRKFARKFARRQKEKERALYIRLPHVIRKQEDVAKFFTGDFKVKPLRQASRHCYVIFNTVEEKLRNLEAMKNTQVNGKRLVVEPAIIKSKDDLPKVNRKKIIIPRIKEDIKVTKTLFVSNIKCGTALQELRAAIPGCRSIKMLKPYSPKSRAAMIKMESCQVAAEYLNNLRDCPVVNGRKLRLNADTRIRVRKSNAPLKIYDGETEIPFTPSIRNSNEVLDHIVLKSDI
ncbi:uncharacterized protein LOC116432551 [Nomia melanderi]|uniref:uncharacterized protein LOC116432551 n=1 Tax=Nomia melanderi TaxID=2448451 RepID=UPI0013044D92|nr:uncharacterized protein LOC116432551 [Nomia melanderi]